MSAATPVKEIMVRPPDFHWTADEFYRAAAAGEFEDPDRLELIHGRLIETMPQSPLHRACRVRVSRLLSAALTPRLQVTGECPVHIAFDGEPIPDILVTRGSAAEDPTRHPRPEEVALLVEIAVTSGENDLGEKALLYAQAGITDYWVALPERQHIVVHRDPESDGYQTIAIAGPEATVTPLAAPDVTLSVRDLLGLQGGEG